MPASALAAVASLAQEFGGKDVSSTLQIEIDALDQRRRSFIFFLHFLRLYLLRLR